MAQVHNNKAYDHFSDLTMKEMNSTIRRNEGFMNKNSHRLKKLDGVYKKNYIVGLKYETQTQWRRLEETSAHSHGVLSSCEHTEDQQNQKKKKQPEVDEKAKREAEEREEMLMLQKQQQAKKEKALKEQQEKEKAQAQPQAVEKPVQKPEGEF